MSERKYEGFVPGRWAIEAYGAGGFRFADMSHRGSIMALPSGVRAWTAVQPTDISIEALAPLLDEPEGTVDLLLVGTGKSLAPIAAAVRQRLREAGIRVDVMATGAAVSTYNILLEEGRPVAAALLATA
jgi:uncharacterized protein